MTKIFRKSFTNFQILINLASHNISKVIFTSTGLNKLHNIVLLRKKVSAILKSIATSQIPLNSLKIFHSAKENESTYQSLNRKSCIAKNSSLVFIINSSVGKGCRLRRLHRCKWLRLQPPLNESPGYDTKLNLKARLKSWVMRITSSFPLLSGPLQSGLVVVGRVLSLGQIERFNHFLY